MDEHQKRKLQEIAINEALKNNWKEAVSINKIITQQDPDDINALLRLGYAYLQQVNLKNSKKAYQNALKINPSNQIARLNLEKIKILEKKTLKSQSQIISAKKNLSDPSLFINIRGKTQVFTLINIGQADILAGLCVGQNVRLSIKKRRVEVRSENSDYIGALPDDVSKRLILLIKGGSVYEAYIKEAVKNNVDVFIKEIRLGKKVRRFVSFPKNIQDDIKTMEEAEAEEEKSENNKTPEEDSENEQSESEDTVEESIVDLDKLAEEAEESDYFGPDSSVAEEDEEEV